MARLFYPPLAWCGLKSTKNRDKLNRFQAKVVQMGYLPKISKAFAEKVEEAEERLFHSTEHNTNHLLRERASKQYNLRPRPHNYVLPDEMIVITSQAIYYNCLNEK